MKLYGDNLSGNCYKVNLVASILGIPLEKVSMNILRGDTRTLEFLQKNPNGKIPILELADGRNLSESNAIVNFLARESELIPQDPFDLAKTQEWQFFEQYSHEPNIAVARFINKYLGLPEERRVEFESKQEGGHKALRVMEEQLSRTQFLVGNHFSVADISLFAYTHVANEGGFDLIPYPRISEWLKSIESIPGFIRMEGF
ncbi:MAG: glutathione S-transferase family protein [Leptospiraceae bacterium]|nr:glutathione S-transferase family protein [Leptospiraceae bacterium]